MSKPRISKGRITGEYWCYDPPLGFNFDINKPIGYGHTPEEAYNDYVRIRDKGFGITVIPPHSIGYQPRPELLVNITYIDPEDMLPEWESSYTYTSGQFVRYKGKVYKLSYVEGRSISSVNKAPDVNYQWVCQSDSGNTYEMRKTSLVEDKPKRWWEIWK